MAVSEFQDLTFKTIILWYQNIVFAEVVMTVCKARSVTIWARGSGCPLP
jgi:hypothetical protein